MKYEIAYTLKDPKSPGTDVKFFKTKKDANSWLKKNSEKLYWHKLTETNAKSKLPRLIVKFEPGQEFILKHGTLQTHYETGMECLGLVLYEDGVRGPPNPNFDPSKPEDHFNFKNFSSYGGLNFISHGQILQIEDGEKIALIKDRDFAARDGFRLSFYPQGFSRFELIQLFGKESIRAKLWLKKGKK